MMWLRDVMTSTTQQTRSLLEEEEEETGTRLLTKVAPTYQLILLLARQCQVHCWLFLPPLH